MYVRFIVFSTERSSKMPKQEYYAYNAWMAPKSHPSKKPQSLMTPAEMAKALSEKEQLFIFHTAQELLRALRDGERLHLRMQWDKSDDEAYPPRVLLGIATELFNAGWTVRFERLSSWDHRTWYFLYGRNKTSYLVHLSPRSTSDLLP
jgi:hypothetical protein